MDFPSQRHCVSGKHNETFEEQKRLNVIEPVEESEVVEGTIHYRAYAAQENDETKDSFRRVSPLQGLPFAKRRSSQRTSPVIQNVWTSSLRFRIGRVALTSDVEKAFSQVRLHEVDRGATCCLWLHQPPSKENLQVYRFTRVIFGLFPSPFLVAATTYYYLNQYSNDGDVLKETMDNLYVENLLVTTWNRSNQLQVACTMTKHDGATKRLVASATASVCDPVG